MITLNLFTVFLMSLACVPISWATPSRFSFDAIAVWTIVCLALLSPLTALWLGTIAVALPMLLSLERFPKGAVAGLTAILLVAGFSVSRFTPSWALIGGAFFTLRALHIVIEWWMGRMARPKFREAIHYFLFLPVLAAGPINRIGHFNHQMRRRRFEPEMFWSGAERVLLGLVWIYLVAGRIIRKLAFKLEESVQGAVPFLQIWSGSALSWIELFFLFVGATHLALGISMMIGLKLEENFDRPWAARNLIEFWTRWHMSLTGWVQDYVFRPITAMTRKPILALFAAMLIIGLWHAFSVYYVLWSVWQSLGIIVSRFASQKIPSNLLPKVVLQVLGPICVLAWLSAARPVIWLLIGETP